MNVLKQHKKKLESVIEHTMEVDVKVPFSCRHVYVGQTEMN